MGAERSEGPGSPETDGVAAPPAQGRPAAGGGSGALVTVLVVLGAALVLGGLWWTTRARELTVLVISLDTTRPDHLGAYGAERPVTPNLDRLAREGVVFEQARTTAPWTLPSHMSLFTGLPPELHGVRYDYHRLPPDRRTMGQVFADAGFRTVGLFTAPYVHANFGFARGMDFYEAVTERAMLYDRDTARMTPERRREIVLETEQQSHREVTSTQLVNRLGFFLKHNPAERSFLFLHFFDPHYDYLPPPAHRRAFVDPDYAGPITGRDVMAHTQDLITKDMPEADLQQLRDLYDAELRYVDAQLGRMLALLEERGELEDTLIAVVADHGEAFFEHGRFGHRQDLTDEVLRIPMIFWGPGRVPAGVRVDQPVSLVDVLPTLVDLAELPAEPDLYGRSLVPLMRGEPREPRPVTALLDFISPSTTDSYERHQSMVFGDLKYLRVDRVSWSPEAPAALDGAVDPDARIELVFDLAADPGEYVDLLDADPDRPGVAQIRAHFEAEQARREAFGAERGWSEAQVGDTELGRLSALGYTGDLDQ